MGSPPDVMNVLATSENHIGLHLAEAQILEQEMAIPVSSSRHESDYLTTTDDELRKMLIQVFIDSAILRKQADSVVCCAIDTADTSPDSTQTGKEMRFPEKPIFSEYDGCNQDSRLCE